MTPHGAAHRSAAHRRVAEASGEPAPGLAPARDGLVVGVAARLRPVRSTHRVQTNEERGRTRRVRKGERVGTQEPHRALDDLRLCARAGQRHAQNK